MECTCNADDRVCKINHLTGEIDCVICCGRVREKVDQRTAHIAALIVQALEDLSYAGGWEFDDLLPGGMHFPLLTRIVAQELAYWRVKSERDAAAVAAFEAGVMDKADAERDAGE